jgi:hypothetical protein
LPASQYGRKLTAAPGNGLPFGGIKVIAGNGWFAARPSGTEDVYKIYAESFRSECHLRQIQQVRAKANHKHAVTAGGFVADEPVSGEPVSRRSSLLTGKFGGKLMKFSDRRHKFLNHFNGLGTFSLCGKAGNICLRPPLAGLCGRDRAVCREQAKFCRARRGMWKAGMTKPCYDVDYGKPPLHARFRKGQSGNPKGRSKGAKNFATIFMTAMSQSMAINENGKRKKISKIAAAVTQLANDAARGDQEIDPAHLCLVADPRAKDRGTRNQRSVNLFRRAGGL